MGDKITYTRYKGVDETGAVLSAQKTVEFKAKLLTTFGDMGHEDFFTYMPVDKIESFLTELLTKGTFSPKKKDILVKVFKNFMLTMPGQSYRSATTSMLHQGIDHTLRETLDNTLIGNQGKEEYKAALKRYSYIGYSDRRLDETTSTFYNNVDQAIVSCGYTLEDILAATKDGASVSIDFYKTYRPIYIQLRKMGYSHKDLVS